VGGYEPVIGGVHFALYLLLALGEAVEIGEVLAAPQPLSAGRRHRWRCPRTLSRP
jgi:hypothetical protein